MSKNIKIQEERFHYCLPMEETEWEYYGIQNRHSGMASAFCNYKYFKKSCRALIKKIKRRINNTITNDEPLRGLLLNDLAFLDNEVKNVSLKSHTEIEIIAYMFKIIAHLLGWDNLEGKFYRTPLYYQTKEQQIETYRKEIASKLPNGLLEGYYRHIIIKQLLSEGRSYQEIALILNLSITNVLFLEKANHFEKFYNELVVKKSEI